jgi:hypothetical protein
MRLFELFEEPSEPVAGDMTKRLRALMLDYLTPLAASGIESVPIDKVVNKVSAMRSGIIVDREAVMVILDPESNNIIEKIDGDAIYFKTADEFDSSSDEDTTERDKEKVEDTAIDQAKKQIKKKNQ